MTQTVNEAVQAYKAELEEDYTINGAVKKEHLWQYVNYTQAIEIIEYVNDIMDEDDDDGDVLQKVVDEYGDLSTLVDEIEDDDYIISDWNSNTEYPEYVTGVISIAQELLK